jgi:hypothetical protein
MRRRSGGGGVLSGLAIGLLALIRTCARRSRYSVVSKPVHRAVSRGTIAVASPSSAVLTNVAQRITTHATTAVIVAMNTRALITFVLFAFPANSRCPHATPHQSASDRGKKRCNDDQRQGHVGEKDEQNAGADERRGERRA